jgi:hypothetical protein
LLYTKIIQEKSRAYIIAKAQQIGTFFPGNLLLFYKICDDFGAHWKSAQKSDQHGIASFIGNSIDPSKYRCIDPVQILKKTGLDQQVGKDQKGQKRRKNGGIPEVQPLGTSLGCCGRMTEKQQKQEGEKQNRQYLFHGLTI